ncbi:hypothetical protein [Rhodococcus opacus]|uniref:Uncharacterized protein n=1 Tax=Rhodococcus opacus TaxID=37919 RepID=A0A2S8IW08_RHOOP|nr:hypothetical protein [Rhodococcus opacus]PQP18961.1 hypothetical protein C5613_31105 [Rhodococcus opacus]
MTSLDSTNTTYTVRLYDNDANGVANILAALLQQNLQAYPERVELARLFRRPVAVFSTETNTSATIIFHHNEAVICNDLVNKPAVVVRATVNQILAVSQLPMKAGGLLPTGFFTRRGVSVLRDITSRTLVVNGLLTHTVTALRMIAILSIAK